MYSHGFPLILIDSDVFAWKATDSYWILNNFEVNANLISEGGPGKGDAREMRDSENVINCYEHV